jgi:hypothetical protein
MPPKRSLLDFHRKYRHLLRREATPFDKEVKQLDANGHAQYSAQFEKQPRSVYLKVRRLHQKEARDEEKQWNREFTKMEQRLAYRTLYTMDKNDPTGRDSFQGV